MYISVYIIFTFILHYFYIIVAFRFTFRFTFRLTLFLHYFYIYYTCWFTFSYISVYNVFYIRGTPEITTNSEPHTSLFCYISACLQTTENAKENVTENVKKHVNRNVK